MPGEGDKSSNCDKMTRLLEVINKINHIPDKSIKIAFHCRLLSSDILLRRTRKDIIYILVPVAFYKRTQTHQTTTDVLISKQFRAVDMILMLVHNLEI